MDPEQLQKALTEATEKAARLEKDLADSKALIEDGKAFRAHLRAEIERKYTSCQMEATGKAILSSLPETTSIEALKAADAEVQKLFDQKFPPSGKAQYSDPAQRDGGNPNASKKWDPLTAFGRRA